MKKIVFLHTENNGCGFWRIWQPARELGKQFPDEYKTVYWPQRNNPPYGKAVDKECEDADLIVAMRCDTREQTIALAAIREKFQRPFIMEMDDDFTDIDPLSCASEYWQKDKEPFAQATWEASFVDGFQVSTPPLMRTVRRWRGQDIPLIVQPNLIDVNLFDKAKSRLMRRICPVGRKRKDGEIRIGWAGSNTHQADVLGIRSAIQKISKEFPQVTFVCRGLHPLLWLNYAGVPPAKLEYHKGKDYHKWHNVVADMDCDFVIVPLKSSRFNDAKSNCRFLEFSLMGYAGIYGNSDPYRRSVSEGETGMLCSDNCPEMWYAKMKYLIQNPEARSKMAQAAREFVIEKYSLQKQIGIWKDNYDKMFKMLSGWQFRSAIPSFGGKIDDLCFRRVYGK